MSPIAIPARSEQPDPSGPHAPSEGVERRVSIPLTQLPKGRPARVHADNLDASDFAALRAMGLRPNATVEVCRLGQHCIVALTGACGGGCRIGIARDLADRVMVQPND